MVLAVTNNRGLNEEIYHACKEEGIYVNVASDKDLCDFYFPGICLKDDVVVGITASGMNHKKARAVREKVQALLEEIAKEMEMSVERVREILKISQEPVSLETPIGEEEDSHLGDFIQDDNVPVPADAAAFTLLKEQLVEVLSTLTDREQKVLRLRFGLDDGRARTLEEVGKEFQVTRERIRQIEAKALRRLRHPSKSRKLKDYLDAND